MLDLPGPGLEPVSPALAGGFLTTVPPGKPGTFLFDWSKEEPRREAQDAAAHVATLNQLP